ncbi:hypothetical protein HYT58_02020 [Candidatus Woesearchaeota archaeon]|nr:hypothetical protein [Candidatus Woesearchaeota archaeon]
MADKKKKKEINKTRIVLISLCAVALISSIVFIYYLLKVEDIRIINFDVKVGDHGAFNLDADKLHFGMITPNGYGFRDIYVASDEDVKVVAKTIGPDFIEYDKNYFVLNGGEKELIRVTARVPDGADFGLYTGKIVIIILEVNK